MSVKLFNVLSNNIALMDLYYSKNQKMRIIDIESYTISEYLK